MNPFEFFIPQNIIVGAGTLVRLPECAQKLGGTHAMLLSGPTLRKMGIVDKAAKYLEDAGMKVDIFTEIEANPSVQNMKEHIKYPEKSSRLLQSRRQQAQVQRSLRFRLSQITAEIIN